MLIYQQVEQISLTRVVNCKCFPKTDSKFKMIWNSNILHNSYCLLISSYVFGLNRNIYIILLWNYFIVGLSVNLFENIKLYIGTSFLIFIPAPVVSGIWLSLLNFQVHTFNTIHGQVNLRSTLNIINIKSGNETTATTPPTEKNDVHS